MLFNSKIFGKNTNKVIFTICFSGLVVGCGGGSSSNTENLSPVADAGADIVVSENETTSLAGGGSDPDGSISEISWDQTSGVAVTLLEADTYKPHFVAPDISTEETLEFELTITDNKGAQSTDIVMVVIRPFVWGQSLPLSNARWGLSACSYNGKIYVFGGADYETLVEEFDIDNQVWEAKAPLTTPRRYGSACAVIGEKIYLVGGYNALNNLDVYDTNANTWTPLSPMPTGRHNLTASVVNNKLYVVGGRNGSSNDLAVVEEYDPENDTWVTKSSLPVGHHGPTSQSQNGRLYVFGGFNSAGSSTLSYEYNLDADVWSEIAFMPTPRTYHSSALIDEKIYIFGGGSSTALSIVEAYNPITNEWSEKTEMPLPRSSHASTSVNGAAYILGGRESSQYSSPISEVAIYNQSSDE